MKRVLLICAFVGMIIATFYLYQLQLGAIGFLSISVFFFSLAWSQYSQYTNGKWRDLFYFEKYVRILHKKELGKK